MKKLLVLVLLAGFAIAAHAQTEERASFPVDCKHARPGAAEYDCLYY